jgi:hypothetical protein
MNVYRNTIKANGIFVDEDDVIIESNSPIDIWYVKVHYTQSELDPEGGFTLRDLFVATNSYYERHKNAGS